MKRAHVIGAGLLAALVVAPATWAASTEVLIDFETLPNLPQGPSFFSEAGPMQVINVPGIATISGGVVLGDASNITNNLFTAPNLYGTADFGDDSLDPVVTISVNPAYVADEIGFLLLNGLVAATEYKVEAYVGATLADSETITIPSIQTGGSHVFEFEIPGVTELKIIPQSLTTWDYFIDSIALNQTVEEGVENPPGPAIPLPATVWMGLVSLGGMAANGYVRRRRAMLA